MKSIYVVWMIRVETNLQGMECGRLMLEPIYRVWMVRVEINLQGVDD